MSWDDRYFEQAPRGSRAFIGFAGVLMILFGVLLALGGHVQHARGDVSTVRSTLVLASGLALALYGLDLSVRTFRPGPRGRTFAGVTGALRLAGLVGFASVVFGVGVFGLVRGEIIVGGFIAAAGICGLLGVMYARLRDLRRGR